VIDGEQGGVSAAVGWRGGGSFVYCELARCNQVFADGTMAAETDAELAALLDRVLATGFISCRVDPAKIRENAGGFDDLAAADKRHFILELLDKNMLYVNLCDMHDSDYGIGEADRAFTRSFYGLGDQ
jgi:adenine-specific DNA-methyltransferase